MDDNRITYFGETDARNRRVKFGIKAIDRTKHMYVIGKTGMGKSTLLENMAVQDIMNGEGLAFVDPHGKSAELLLDYIPEHRIKDVIYFAPFDTDYPISFNVLESVDEDKRHLVVAGLMSTFKKIWQDAWSARMEYILTNTLLALLEYPGATLLGVNRMLSEKEFRKDVVDKVTDISVKNFWTKEFANYTERMAAEAVPAIQNKIGQFTANALIRNMIGQPQSSFDIRKVMDERKIVIINLSKGRIGEANANLLGGMLITKIYLGAMSRADVPDRILKTLPNFYLFVDEFQNFANESFADILSEARKYKLNLTIAHQYIEQMEEEVRSAVFGNVGTMITFRVGAYDAEVLEKEFAPQFTMEDIVNLGRFQMYLKLMIDGISSSPFSATTLPPIPTPAVSNAPRVIEASRQQFAHTRADVEASIEKWHEPKVLARPVPVPAKRPLNTPAPAPITAVVPAVDAPVPAPQQKSGLGLGSLIKHVQETSTKPAPREIKEREVVPVKPKPAARELPPEKILARLGPEEAIAQGLVTPVEGNSIPGEKKPKTDIKVNNTQKVATKENVNSLKNALTALMKEGKLQVKPEVKEPTVKPASGKPVIKIKEKETDMPKPPVPQPPKKDEASVPEVPKSVLEDLLNVEK